MKRFWVAIVAISLFACAPTEEPADLVLMGGRIVTMDAGYPEATALASRDGRLVAVGTEREIDRFIGPETEVIDLGGALAVPGLIEGHGALSRRRQGDDAARSQRRCRFRRRSWPWSRRRSQRPNRGSGFWVVAGTRRSGSSTPEPNVSGLPYNDGLSAVSPDNPVFLTHASGHASMVNAVALEMAGIDRETPDPPGGEIVRDGRGRAIGVLLETAEDLVGELIDNGWDEATIRRMVELASEESLAHGITSFQDAGSSFRLVELLGGMAEAGELPVRLWIMLSEDNESLAAGLPGYEVYGKGDESPHGRRHQTLGGRRPRFARGVAARALQRSPGQHRLQHRDSRTSCASRRGWRPSTGSSSAAHAIGDRANRVTLDVYEETIASRADGRELRWRVEHAQHLDPADLPRFEELGVDRRHAAGALHLRWSLGAGAVGRKTVA